MPQIDLTSEMTSDLDFAKHAFSQPFVLVGGDYNAMAHRVFKILNI